MLVDRAPGVALIESMMVDECVVTRDDLSHRDETLDESTFQLIPAVNNEQTLYEGKCVVATIRTSDREVLQGAAPLDVNTYKVFLPLENTGGIRIGDIVTITKATNDPALLGQSYRVVRTEITTHKLYRYLKVEQVFDAIGSIREV